MINISVKMEHNEDVYNEDAWNAYIQEFMNAFMNNDLEKLFELIDEFREEHESENELEYNDFSDTDISLIDNIIESNHPRAFEFIKWFIDDVAICPEREHSKGIYMFFAFRTSVFQHNNPNLQLAFNILNHFGNRINAWHLYEREYVKCILENFVEEDNSNECKPHVIRFIINTVYNQNYINGFRKTILNKDHLDEDYINENRNMLINSISRFE